MALVYSHTRLDTNEIFYIGIELDSNNPGIRPKTKSRRSKFWKNIINKTNYSIDIIYNNLENQEAKELEIFLIKLYGRRDLGLGNLTNLTNGGDGALGKITSSDVKLKISKSLLGKNKGINNPMYGKNPYENKIHYNAKQVINIETNIVYNTITEVSKKFNIPKTTLLRWLSNPNKNKSVFRYY